MNDAPFIAAILAAPEDDMPRLIYADWLDEQGEGGRAEFIRVQCAIEAIPRIPGKDGPRCVALRRRERELLEAHGDVWFAPVVPCLNPNHHHPTGRGDIPGVPRRGFIESVRLTSEDWLSHGDEILLRQPVREVRLTTWASSRYQDDPSAWEEGYPQHFLSYLLGRWPAVKDWHLPETRYSNYVLVMDDNTEMDLPTSARSGHGADTIFRGPFDFTSRRS